MHQYGWFLKIQCQVKEARHKGIYSAILFMKSSKTYQNWHTWVLKDRINIIFEGDSWKWGMRGGAGNILFVDLGADYICILDVWKFVKPQT